MTSVKNLTQNISFMIPQTNKRVIFGQDKFSSLLQSSAAVWGKTSKTTVLPGFTKTWKAEAAEAALPLMN